ncbi:MAG: hypothetical protein LUD41_07335 [Phascolarctobacterium sp.]|nr:hypothetical protein [Phascolarctobacterium sp.]
MNSEEKKAAVERLYSSVLLKGNRQAAEELLHESYKQHNPRQKMVEMDC